MWWPLSAAEWGAEPKPAPRRTAVLQVASARGSDMNAVCGAGVKDTGLQGALRSWSLLSVLVQGQGMRRRSAETDEALESSSVAKLDTGTVVTVPATGRALRRANARKASIIGSGVASSGAETFIT